MQQPDAQSSPNIIMFQADQLTALALATYGNAICSHPKIDELAENGAVFENMYCNFPLCAPSRYSMMTGQLASKIGAFDNAAELPASIPTVAHYMRNLGYKTCLSGKMHFVGPDQLHGFEERLTSDIYPADFQWSANWMSETHVDVTDTRGVTKSGLCEDSVQIRYDDGVTEATQKYLQAQAASTDGRPLFLTVSYTHPHDPFVCTEEYWNRYDGLDIPMPNVGALSENEHDPHSRKILTQAGLFGVTFTDDQIRNARRGYFGSVSYFDDQIRKICETLESLGMDDNTVIVVTSDHGEMLGERGMWFKKNFFESAVRIPLIVFDPRQKQGRRIAAPVSLVDLLPTFAAIGNGGQDIETCEPLDGRSLLPLMYDPSVDWPYPVISEILSEGVTAPAFMIRRGRYKYIHSGDYAPILYDLDDDPDELTNLSGTPELASLEESFRQEIADRWNEDQLTQRIIKDQQRRLFIQKTLTKGKYTPWDFNAGGDAQKDWFRGQTSYNEWAFDYVPRQEPDETKVNHE
ncbi:choline-sulfatase [Roseovarius sp. 2305UL8-3]|uniref:choline-sulfatase n=1 Tax=Roseovarius conchicola TaxID=3121636 RepID=UPI00352889F4